MKLRIPRLNGNPKTLFKLILKTCNWLWFYYLKKYTTWYKEFSIFGTSCGHLLHYCNFSQVSHHTLSPSTHSHSTVCPIPCSVMLCSVTFNVQSFCVQSHSILSHCTFSRAALDHSTFNISTFSEGIHRPKMNINPRHGKMSWLRLWLVVPYVKRVVY